jgi:AcrR family transcriptional regulator
MRSSKNNQTRQRLLEAAKELFYQQGVSGTTIAHVATASGVPLGNVYYHFRTKEALTEAVIAERRLEVLADIEQLSRHSSPFERLWAFLQDSRSSLDLLTAHGCPYASLAHRLRDEESHLADDAGALLRLYLEFLQNQFGQLGLAAPELAASELMIRLYGAFSLSNAMNDPEFLQRGLWQLEVWLERITSKNSMPSD